MLDDAFRGVKVRKNNLDEISPRSCDVDAFNSPGTLWARSDRLLPLTLRLA